MADVGEEANMEKDFFEKDEKEGQTKNGYLIQEKKIQKQYRRRYKNNGGENQLKEKEKVSAVAEQKFGLTETDRERETERQGEGKKTSFRYEHIEQRIEKAVVVAARFIYLYACVICVCSNVYICRYIYLYKYKCIYIYVSGLGRPGQLTD